MKPIKLTFCLLLALFISACQTEDEIPTEPETQRRIVSSSDIPQVTSSLLNQLGLKKGNKGFSVYSEGNAVGVAIDWDKVKQLIDTTGKQTYTFAIKDQDNDPNTFYNLIFQLSPENEPYKPYLMKYTMNDAFATAYYSGQANFGSFQGSVKKIRIQGFGNTSGNTYNDDGDEVLVGEDCPGDTQFNNDNGQGSTGSGGGSYDGIPIGEDDPDEDWMCEVFIQPTDWYSCTSTGCTYMYTDYEITYENCGLNTQLSSADDDGLCQPTDDNIPIIEPDNALIEELLDLLSEDPDLLLNIPCSEIEKWMEVAEHKVSSQIIDKLESLNRNYIFDIFDVQTLQSARTPTVNMDFFSVTVTELPNGMSGDSFLEYIRRNMNNFVDTSLSSFEPYNSADTNESVIWNSSNPVGAIIHIKIPVDDASVVCSDYTKQRWRFSTISSPQDLAHPVSGTREFGYYRNIDASYTFYTRGVDRLSVDFKNIGSNGLSAFLNLLNKKVAFNGADNLWKSFQDGIEGYVNSNGGYAYKNNVLIHRPQYSLLEQVLLGNLPISALGCD